MATNPVLDDVMRETRELIQKQGQRWDELGGDAAVLHKKTRERRLREWLKRLLGGPNPR